MPDNSARKLGRKPVLTSRLIAAPVFPDYAAKLPAPPVAADWCAKVSDFGMMLNDDLGDCAIACPGHMIQAWTADNGAEYIPSDQDILAAYEAVGGYKPGDESTDNGCVVLDVLRFWHDHGIAGRKLAAYARVRAGNVKAIKQAVAMFGGVYLGLDLPAAWQDADTWDVGRGPRYLPGSWGGHAVPALAYDADKLTVVTWGQRMPLTWPALERYASEIWVVLSQDWSDADGAPSGLDMAQLGTDLGYFHGRPS